MNYRFSLFLGITFASLAFLLTVTSRANSAEFMSHASIVQSLQSVNRSPSSLSLSVTNRTVDLRRFDSAVESQFGGTCSAFAVAAAMDNSLRAHGVNKQVSKRHLWSTYGRYDVEAAVRAASNNYIVEYPYWPTTGSRAVDYRDHQSLRITQSTTHGYNLENALQGLDRGNPVAVAVQVPSDLSHCKPTISATSSRTKGQHVMTAVGYQLDASVPGGGYLILKNSWGQQCGDQGYHYFPFQLCKRTDLYCFFIEVASVEARN